VYIYAGLRREEALWLIHDDVDLERRLIRVVVKTVDGEFWQPKTKRNRVVPVSKALLQIIRNHVQKQACRWYFPSPAGKRWDPDNFSHDLRAINHKQGLPW
jgi:integrase